jgi:hypothetical protein
MNGHSQLHLRSAFWTKNGAFIQQSLLKFFFEEKAESNKSKKRPGFFSVDGEKPNIFLV